MPHLTFDQWLHVAELLTFAWALVRGGLTFRDSLRDLVSATKSLRGEVDDHEDRLRSIEGKPMRRKRDEVNVSRKSVLGIFG